MKIKSFSVTGVAAFALVAAALSAVPASAQMGGGPGYGPGMMGQGAGYMGPGQGGWGPGFQRAARSMMGGCGGWMTGDADGELPAFIEGRAAFLKAELGVTDAQAKAWDAYVVVMKNNFVSMQGLRQAMRASFDADTPVERLESRIAVMEARAAALKDMKQPLSGLYAALSDGQKKKANELLTGMGCMM
ncbi:Spy/CpxP family protein refolding chaperone [Xanthobacter autotrophicus]|uniref:Spy/CpxP family protein refolding chaperone n=1 Tax=Xanthobacter TaxID=279 RepID=UPI0024AB49FA|nr:Spy/CpxP family protein refolding chaperone [Xanthobacter autotrophicus]MDI4663727.1 Spy/CpxP family protein refolding chaperone [Xanthobacter autotrophicus]